MEQYKVIYNNSVDILIGIINMEMHHGWMPLGGISINQHSVFFQALIRIGFPQFPQFPPEYNPC